MKQHLVVSLAPGREVNMNEQPAYAVWQYQDASGNPVEFIGSHAQVSWKLREAGYSVTWATPPLPPCLQPNEDEWTLCNPELDERGRQVRDYAMYEYRTDGGDTYYRLRVYPYDMDERMSNR